MQDCPAGIGFPYAVDYRAHPAFADLPAWDEARSGALTPLMQAFNQEMLGAERRLTLNQVALPEAVAGVRAPLQRLLDQVREGDGRDGAGFGLFMEHLQAQCLRIIIDDLAYFERRNAYRPVFHSPAQLTLRNQIGIQGFVAMNFPSEEMQALLPLLRPYQDTILDRHARGERSRERLSINEIDPATAGFVCAMFDRIGLNKAVSDLRHEPARADGFAIELSVPEARWWHSRYEDAGLSGANRCAYLHNDESRDVYKAIILLSDCAEDTGPFSFIPDSYRAERPRLPWVLGRAMGCVSQSLDMAERLGVADPELGFWSSPIARSLFMRLPACLRQNSHVGFDILDDSDLSRRLLAEEVLATGPVGQVVAFDGARLLHRGGLVRQGLRWAMQVVFNVDKGNGLRLLHSLQPPQTQG